MTDTITITGIVATTPRTLTTSSGLDIASFRLASTQRRYDQKTQEWVDGDTNWYTITGFRHLAANVHASINKGDRLIVTGKLRLREWESGDKRGINVEIEADTIGHDLAWGTSSWARTRSTATADDASEQDTEATSPATEPARA